MIEYEWTEGLDYRARLLRRVRSFLGGYTKGYSEWLELDLQDEAWVTWLGGRYAWPSKYPWRGKWHYRFK